MVMQNLQKMYNTCYVIVNMFIVLKIIYILVISVYFDKCDKEPRKVKFTSLKLLCYHS